MIKILKKAIEYCKEMNYSVRKLPNKNLYKCVDLYNGDVDVVGADVLIAYYNMNFVNGKMF